jgi:hypothetical protein
MHRYSWMHIQQILRPRHSTTHLPLQARLLLLLLLLCRQTVRISPTRNAILARPLLRPQTPKRRPRPQNQLRIRPAVVDAHASYLAAETAVDEELGGGAD